MRKFGKFAKVYKSRVIGVNTSRIWNLRKVAWGSNSIFTFFRRIQQFNLLNIFPSCFRHFPGIEFCDNDSLNSERIAELKVQEYMRQKLEREKRLALEKRLAKEEKEKEYDRILQRQQKLMESKTERNELEYRRAREEVERDFRRREKEAAIKKREMADQIAKARSVQLEEVVS